MSRFFKGPSSNKRSSSYCEYTSRSLIRAIPCPQEFPNQNQTMSAGLSGDESFCQLNKYSTLHNLSHNEHSKYDSGSSAFQEVERLTFLNTELRRENKALTNKLIENSSFQQKICQLEAQNKQLMKELGRKDEIIRSSSREGSPIKQSVASRGIEQPCYVEILTQNKILSDEVAWLKKQLDGVIFEKSAAETKSYEVQKLEAKLEEANSQIDLLKEDLIKKNYEIEELRDRTTQRRRQDNARSLTPTRIRSNDFPEGEKEKLIGRYSFEAGKLKEENCNLQIRLEQAIKRSEIAEEELQILRRKTVEREAEFNHLNERFRNIDQVREEELRIKERELERVIKGRSNEAIKQMLQEKLQYQERINYLEEKINSLETENARIKVNAEEEWRQMELENRNLAEEKARATRVLSVDEERLHREIVILNETLTETENALRDCKQEKTKVYGLLASQEKEAVKMQKELEVLGSEIVVYQERMKSLERQYQQEKEDLKRREQGYSELAKKLETLEKRLYQQEKIAEDEKNQYKEELELITRQLREAKESKIQLGQVKAKLEEENDLLSAKLANYKEKLSDAESKLNYATRDSEKFKTLYSDTTKKLDSERRHQVELEREYTSQQEDLKREHNQAKERDLDLRETTLKFNAERRQYDSEIKQLKTMKESAEEHVEKLYELLAQRKRECEAYSQENEQLWNETERLRGILENTRGVDEAELQKERCKLEIERLNKGLEEANIELSRKIEQYDDEQ